MTYKLDTKVALAAIENLAGLGMKLPDIGTLLGVSRSTMYLQSKDNEKVKEALAKGKAKAIAKVAQTSFEMASSGKYPDMTKFWLKCQAGWEDKQTINITPSYSEENKVHGNLLEDLSDAELEVFEKILLKDKLLKEANQKVIDIEAKETKESNETSK